MARLILALVFFTFSFSAISQSTADTTVVSTSEQTYFHSPKRAAMYSAVLPGLGQMYNRKWWKVPIVYAAVGTAVGFTVYNHRKYRTFKTAYINRLNDPTLQDEFTIYSENQLFEIQDTYHEWRDISIICLAGAYVLNIVDAVVDAHFFRFDVDEKLSLYLQPEFGGASLGFNYRF